MGLSVCLYPASKIMNKIEYMDHELEVLANSFNSNASLKGIKNKFAFLGHKLITLKMHLNNNISCH